MERIPVERSTGIPAKAGQFLSCKHTVSLCRDDIMLTFQIVLGRNILMCNIWKVIYMHCRAAREYQRQTRCFFFFNILMQHDVAKGISLFWPKSIPTSLIKDFNYSYNISCSVIAIIWQYFYAFHCWFSCS